MPLRRKGETFWKLFTGAESISKGYQRPLNVYPYDTLGNRERSSSLIVVELAEEDLGKRMDGDVLKMRFVNHAYRVTLLHVIGS